MVFPFPFLLRGRVEAWGVGVACEVGVAYSCRTSLIGDSALLQIRTISATNTAVEMEMDNRNQGKLVIIIIIIL